MTHPLPDPVQPPKGGYNDFHPPPAPKLGSIEGYAKRIREDDRAPGAAWRLCTITQPRSVQELIGHVWHGTPVPTDVGLVLADAYSDWVEAGKPAVHLTS